MIRNVSSCIVALTLAAGLVQGCDRASGSGSAAPSDKGQGPVQNPQQAVATEADGAPADGATVATDSLTFTFKVDGADLNGGQIVLQGFECKLGDNDTFKTCGGDKTPFILSGLKHGESYALIVRGILKDTVTGATFYAAELPLHFKVDLSAPGAASDPSKAQSPGQGNIPGPVTTDGTRTLSSQLLLGSAYEVDVPAGLHVTEYSSTKTTGMLSFFRITNEADPYYATQYTCNQPWDRLIASIAPAGDALMYCHSTPTRDAYKADSEYRLAHNHVEVATDTKLVGTNDQERLAVAVYDSDFEFANVRSRFWNACQNSERRSITVPMIPNFFVGTNPEKVDFWYCDTYQTDVDGRPVLWRIGAFTDVDHMDWNCDDCKYTRALEAVYMVRANAAVFLPAQFAKTAQTRILSVLKKLTP